MKEKRKWLQECLNAYNNLLYICGDKSFTVEDSEFFDFRHNIDESFIKTLFPIFNDIKTKSTFSFQTYNQYENENIIKTLNLYIIFHVNHRKDYDNVMNWFTDSIFEEFTIHKLDNTTWMIEMSVENIINNMLNNEIKELRQDCEEKAKPFYENLENQLLSDYEEKCLSEDEYYLGVRFISYDGEYPTYCSGTICLEIEGIPYEFRLFDLQEDKFTYNLNSIKPEAFDENIRRYHHEIMRIIRKNLSSTCCGGCE